MENIIPWELIIARLKQASTPEQNVLFERWIAEESNAQLFREIEILWEEIRSEVSEARPDPAASWKKMEARLKKNRLKKNRPKKQTKKQTKNQTDSQPRKITIRGLFYPFVAAAAAVLLLVGLSYSYLDYRAQSRLQTYSTLYGKSKIILPDSSVVWLNAGTTIRYASAFARDRQLHLDGEASFEVAKDKKHPFTVSTGGMKVRVYGTAFNVNSYASAEHIQVALHRGSVSLLLENGSESFLKPGEIATLDKKNQQLKIEETDTRMEAFWASESISFKNKSLGYICKYLEKWYRIRIEVDPEIASSQYYTFTVKDDSIEAILRIMAKINPIAYTFDENNTDVKITKVKP